MLLLDRWRANAPEPAFLQWLIEYPVSVITTAFFVTYPCGSSKPMLDERFSLFATAEHEFSHRSAAFVHSSQIHFGRKMFVMNHRLDLLGVRNIMKRVGVQKHKVSGLAHIDRSTSWGAPTALAAWRKAACSAFSGVNPASARNCSSAWRASSPACTTLRACFSRSPHWVRPARPTP